MMIRMGRAEKREAVGIATAELKSIPGFTKEQAHVLQTALGTMYFGADSTTGDVAQVRVLTRDYDRKLATAAEAAGLGQDFQAYLKAAYPQLLEGRLRTSDALQPQFIKENVSTVLALAQNNLKPFSDKYSHLLRDYLYQAGPSLATVPEWRAGVREFLMTATTSQLKKFGEGIGIYDQHKERGGPWASPYRALFWNVGDIFEDVAAAKKGSETQDALERLAPGFPRNGTRDLAKRALSVGSKSVLDGLTYVPEVALTDFYEMLSSEIHLNNAVTINPRVLSDLLAFSLQRLENAVASRSDARLIHQILPRMLQAEEDYNSPMRVLVLEQLEGAEQRLSFNGGISAEDRAYFRQELKAAVQTAKAFQARLAVERAAADEASRIQAQQLRAECQGWFEKLSRVFKR